MKIFDYLPENYVYSMNPFDIQDIEEGLQPLQRPMQRNISLPDPEQARIARKDGEHLLYIALYNHCLN